MLGQKYIIYEKLGNGATCKVYKGYNIETGDTCAIKIYKAYTEDMYKCMVTEINAF